MSQQVRSQLSDPVFFQEIHLITATDRHSQALIDQQGWVHLKSRTGVKVLNSAQKKKKYVKVQHVSYILEFFGAKYHI